MKQCPQCGIQIAADNAKFCPSCGAPCPAMEVKRDQKAKDSEDVGQLVGDKNLINESTIIGKQEKYEASSITVHNTTVEDDSRKIVKCAVSGKQIYMDKSVKCPVCECDVSLEYYVEHSKRCENCEQKAHDDYRVFAVSVVGGAGPIDAALKQQLDAEAKRLRIDAQAQASILRLLQQRPAGGNTVELSSVQRSELDAAVKRVIAADDREEALRSLETIAVLHEISSNYEVDYWYFLGRAIVDPAESVKSYEDELTDNYWQRYWGFLAYCNTGSPKGGAAVDRLRAVFGEREDDIRLAEVVYYLARGFDSFELPMLERASELAESVNKEQLSKPLVMVYDALQTLVHESIRLDKKYSAEDMFIFLNIFRAGKYIQYLFAEQERQQKEEQEAQELKERREREEQLRRENEQKAAERARQQKQAELAADRSKRMNEEMARLGGKPAAGADQKAFAGYDTAVPVKKSNLGRNIVIGVIVVIVLIGILFLIPAPDSLQ
ncbi:zinc ribbon domain-containing protein [uncultured Alistipes sp.]|jgi:hypothetical protein|uniref:zinc ribbon domain-containing protein n=1 Tax=uncultured Alistipes sp. TaxID=538949 RepID=UPI0025E8439F|nr:zinc ribbon domain-containing protein [uncultured Alistipes sp.]